MREELEDGGFRSEKISYSHCDIISQCERISTFGMGIILDFCSFLFNLAFKSFSHGVDR